MLWADKSPQLFSKIFIFCIFTAFKAVINRVLHIAKMKEEGKSYYEAPAITVVKVKIEGVVCQSLDGIESAREGYGIVIEESWGGA